MELYQMYHPQIAKPFEYSNQYVEVQPCKALLPYIRCFWGSIKPYVEQWSDVSAKGLLIPDSCLDIIFKINYTNNTIDSFFCGPDDIPSRVDCPNPRNFTESLVATFGIRFYAWTAVLFSEESMKNTKGITLKAKYFFPNLIKNIENILFDANDIYDKVRLIQQYFLDSIHIEHQNKLVLEAIYIMLSCKGNMKITQLKKKMHISERQLERCFSEYIGLSPKELSSLFRYQFLWNDILYKKKFNILDEVYQLGYADQAHLLNDFKRYHTMTPKEAKAFALNDVGFLQAIKKVK